MITEKLTTLVFSMVCAAAMAVSGFRIPAFYQTAIDGIGVWEALEGGGILALLTIAVVAMWRKLAANDKQKDELIEKLLKKIEEDKK